MERIYLFIIGVFAYSIANAQGSATESFRLGHELIMMDTYNATKELMKKDYSFKQYTDHLIIASTSQTDIRIVSHPHNKNIIDTIRIESKTGISASLLNNLLHTLGYQFIKDYGYFSSWICRDIKVAVFNPYNYKDYKIGYIFVRVKKVTNNQNNSRPNKIITVNNVGFKMVYVEGGSFHMGYSLKYPDNTPSHVRSDIFINQKPSHKVSLRSYYIGETEVTQKLWQAVMGNNPSENKKQNNPVESVSWEDCQVFIRKLNSLTGISFRLPTEAEWEYAAHGGKKSLDFKYAGSNDLNNVGWYSNNSEGRTHEVCMKKANELGLYDMTGNVWEWCQDWYGLYDTSVTNNPTGPKSGNTHVIRGGAWININWALSIKYRDFELPNKRSSYIGLRLAMDL